MKLPPSVCVSVGVCGRGVWEGCGTSERGTSSLHPMNWTHGLLH